jgi:hypothetical protein
MAFAGIRFWAHGWIHDLYIAPEFHFSWFGLDFIQPIPGIGMYLVFAVMIAAAVAMALGWRYRIAAITFFVLFTYVELIDKATYLNHYYFISVMAFLLCLVPANGHFSLDARAGRIRQSTVPRFVIGGFLLQIGIVYFFAGVAKLHPDWLLEAQPMRIWLPARADFPVIGSLFRYEFTAYFFSWFGAIYDLTIPFFLLWSLTRRWAYLAVIAFHVMTWLLFQIGIFPWVMIFMTLIFFPANAHEAFWSRLFGTERVRIRRFHGEKKHLKPGYQLLFALFTVHFIAQLALPLRSHLLTQDLFWTETGYRFSWRVMLMEKAGAISFKVTDATTGRSSIVDNSAFLTQLQETQMSTQPDMILQFAQHIAEVYKTRGIASPKVFAESFVTLNGSGSRVFIDPSIDLLSISPNQPRETWVTQRKP